MQKSRCNCCWKGEQSPWLGRGRYLFHSGLLAGAGLLATQSHLLGCIWDQMTEQILRSSVRLALVFLTGRGTKNNRYIELLGSNLKTHTTL